MTLFASLVLSALLALAALARPQGSPTSPIAPAPRPDVVIPFEQANRAIFIQVIVSGRPLWFVLDTGDKYAVIDLDVAHALGLDLGSPIPVGGAGSAVAMGSLVKNSPFEVSGLAGFSQPLFIAMPLHDLAKAEGHAFSGVLGGDFISQFVVEIDYVQHTLTLHDKAAYQYAGAGRALDITFNADGHPQAHAEVVDAAGHPSDGTFTLDIGSTDALILNAPFVEQGHLLQPGQTTVPLQGGQGIGGGLAGAVGRLSALKLAGFVVRKPVTVFTQSKAGAFASAEMQGNIGGAVLDRFKVTLDYGRSRVFLEPNARFLEPMDYDMSGIALSASGPEFKTFHIDAVLPNSPGAAAGLEAGDELTQVDGSPAARYSLSDLRSVFRRPSTLSLTIERDGAPRSVVLRLRPLV